MQRGRFSVHLNRSDGVQLAKSRGTAAVAMPLNTCMQVLRYVYRSDCTEIPTILDPVALG